MENSTPVKGNGVTVIDAQPKPTIEAFVSALNAGVQQWETAGRILVSLRNNDDDAFKRINKAHPFITIETLEIFYHIGQRTIYPLIVLLPRHAFKALREMKYEQQVELCQKPIEIVSRMSFDKPVVLRKPIAQMSADECKKALWRKGNRSVEHQAKILQTPVVDIDGMLPKLKLPSAARVPVVVGRYAVLRAAAGAGFAFEKTMANPYNVQRILLEGGQAVIELTEWPKE
jgi:hypothetical protein